MAIFCSSSNLLDETLKLAVETEEIGDGILTDLDSQKEVLLRSQKNARQTQGYANQAKSILKVK